LCVLREPYVDPRTFAGGSHRGAQGAGPDEFVVALVKPKGWSEKRILQAFTAYYEERTGKAIPDRGGSIEAAKDAFFYLLTFITLGVWTAQLGAWIAR
jgi:hypothetical protein